MLVNLGLVSGVCCGCFAPLTLQSQFDVRRCSAQDRMVGEKQSAGHPASGTEISALRAGGIGESRFIDYEYGMPESSAIDRIVQWGAALEAKARSDEVIVAAEACAPTPNPAARVDFENSSLLARITLWSDGSFHAEAIDAGTSGAIISRHGHLSPSVSFDDEFADILTLFDIR
jgi:hypothetical protein